MFGFIDPNVALNPVASSADSAASAGDNGSDVITTDVSGARTRSTAELTARIKQAGGALVVDANSSDYIVAANNGLRFSVTRQADGRYQITASNAYLYAIIGAGLIGILLIARK